MMLGCVAVEADRAVVAALLSCNVRLCLFSLCRTPDP